MQIFRKVISSLLVVCLASPLTLAQSASNGSSPSAQTQAATTTQQPQAALLPNLRPRSQECRASDSKTQLR
jgi:hypothetical protein